MVDSAKSSKALVELAEELRPRLADLRRRLFAAKEYL